MRKLQYIYLGILILFSGACSQFDNISNVEDVRNISTSVKVDFVNIDGMPVPDSYKVKLNNYADNYELTVNTNENGTVIIDNIIPGIYTITVSGEKNYNGFTYNFNGNLVNINLTQDKLEKVVSVAASKSGNIVFKEVFYAGSKTPKGGSYFRDQYYELYNNTESVQYVDKLCIGNLNPNTATANLPTWPGEDANDYIYFSTIWQVPGNGTDYPIQPGESIIIAQMADNHQREALNPTSPVNLLSAEFETLVKTTAIIMDNPAQNMKMAFWPSPTPQWLVTVFGGAYALFYANEPIDPNNYVSPVGRVDKAYKVHVNDIVDALELVNDETKIKLKRIPAILDAGAATVGAAYCTKSVARKIKETLPDGRIIYMDTNNSSEDFEVMDNPTIRRNGAKIPSWNVWAN